MSVVQVVDGKVAVGDKVSSFVTGQSSEVLELGLMTPEPLRVKELRAGEEGLWMGMKEGGRGFSRKFSFYSLLFFLFIFLASIARIHYTACGIHQHANFATKPG